MSPLGSDLRLFQYFVAVAEVEHVGRAAAKLHISQSPLSRQVQKLEDALGLRLFHREKQRIRLTPDGTWLLGEARRVLASVADLEARAARRARGELGNARVGFVKNAMWTAVLPRALRLFRASRPEVTIDVHAAPSPAQRARLRAGELDVGIVSDTEPSADLTEVVLLSEPMLLAIPRAHPLAARPRIGPADLDGADFVALSARDPLLVACAAAGFTPNIRYVASDQATALGLVDAGMGCAFFPKSVESEPREGVILRSLPWSKRERTLRAVWRASDDSPLVAELVRSLRAGAQTPKRPGISR